jgi:hypothetical protein
MQKRLFERNHKLRKHKRRERTTLKAAISKPKLLNEFQVGKSFGGRIFQFLAKVKLIKQ